MKKLGFSWKSAAYLVAGNLGYALALDLFFVGNNIAAGGFSGLGIVVCSFVPVSIGVFMLAISVPLLIWAYFVHGWRYVLSALVSTVMYSTMVDAFAFLPTLTTNRPAAALCGGVMSGLSAALLLRGNASGGGTDLLARLLVTRFRHISIGAMLFICDGVVVTLSMIVFGDVESGLYAAMAIAVCSYVMDWAVRGFNRASVFQIVTDAPADELAAVIMREMDRGVTCFPATGMYGKKPKSVLMVVVRPREIYAVKDIVKRYAPDAFVMLSTANEILGEGFRGIDVTVPIKQQRER